MHAAATQIKHRVVLWADSVLSQAMASRDNGGDSSASLFTAARNSPPHARKCTSSSSQLLFVRNSATDSSAADRDATHSCCYTPTNIQSHACTYMSYDLYRQRHLSMSGIWPMWPLCGRGGHFHTCSILAPMTLSRPWTQQGGCRWWPRSGVPLCSKHNAWHHHACHT
jgi:hypothetical protein